MKTVLVVDPIHSGLYLTSRLKENGFNTVILKTLGIKEGYFKDDVLNESRVLLSSGDVDRDIQMIQACADTEELVHGVAGTEASLEYADKLLNKLFPFCWNSEKTTSIRYKKFDMQERLKESGLPSIPCERLAFSLSLDEKKARAIDFYRNHQADVIVKPDCGMFSSGFIFPSTEHDITRYLASEQEENLFAHSDVLIQKRVCGVEYYADVVSHEGIHHICAIGRAEKVNSTGVVKDVYKELITLKQSEHKKMFNFICNVLDALDVAHGFSHLEFIQTDKNLYLIELNPRVSGLSGGINRMTKAKYNRDQIDIYTLFLENKYTSDICLSTHDNKIWRLVYLHNLNDERYACFVEKLSQLPSYHLHQVVGLNNKAHYSSLMDVSVFVIFCHVRTAVINRDMQAVFAVQNTLEIHE